MNVSDLHHEWPADFLHHDTRYLFGLTINELMIVALPTMGALAGAGLAAGLVTGAAMLLAMIRFAGLGDRALLPYLTLRVLGWLRPNPVKMPLIMPTGAGEVVVQDWDGLELMRIDAPETRP